MLEKTYNAYMAKEVHNYVSRGGLKMEAALEAFKLDVTDFTCVDLGCNVGGFTDCLLQNGAAKVYSIDTGYAVFAWKLRNDDRVVVKERTNALHCEPLVNSLDLAVIDMSWTKQAYTIPAALKWKPKHIISLIKPHYEMPKDPSKKKQPMLSDEEGERIVFETGEKVAHQFGFELAGCMMSPVRGGKSKGKKGNREGLAYYRVID